MSSIIRAEKDDVLVLGIGASSVAANPRGSAGVLVWKDIPTGATVFARVDRPTTINGSVDGPSAGEVSDGTSQPYAFELAPFPPAWTIAGVQFGGPYPVSAGSDSFLQPPRTTQRALVADGYGGLTPTLVVPTFVAFSAPQTGSLVQKGRLDHVLPMPGGVNSPANTPDKSRRILRLRWTGTLVTAESQTGILPNTPNGTTRKFTGTVAGTNLDPGSVVVNATIASGAIHLRDNGDGRLGGAVFDGSGNVTAWGTGFIDYITGDYELSFGPPPPASAIVPDNSTAITITYEKNCLYRPIGVHLDWDAEVPN